METEVEPSRFLPEAYKCPELSRPPGVASGEGADGSLTRVKSTPGQGGASSALSKVVVGAPGCRGRVGSWWP